MYEKRVLIETYWNVNLGSSTLESSALRINRNILECKFIKDCDKKSNLEGINRNILECKCSKANS